MPFHWVSGRQLATRDLRLATCDSPTRQLALGLVFGRSCSDSRVSESRSAASLIVAAAECGGRQQLELGAGSSWIRASTQMSFIFSLFGTTNLQAAPKYNNNNNNKRQDEKPVAQFQLYVEWTNLCSAFWPLAKKHLLSINRDLPTVGRREPKIVARKNQKHSNPPPPRHAPRPMHRRHLQSHKLHLLIFHCIKAQRIIDLFMI